MRIVLSFVGHRGTNEVADVSVIEANDHVWSCPCTHGCVLTAINVIEERRTANCRVVVGKAGSARVIKRERDITNGGVFSGENVVEKRGFAKGVVAESVKVVKERKGADSIVEVAKTGCEESLNASAALPTAVLPVANSVKVSARAPTAVWPSVWLSRARQRRKRCCSRRRGC